MITTRRSSWTPLVFGSLAIIACLATGRLFGPETRALAQDAPIDWTQWRGPKRNGEYAGPAWPSSLDEEHFTRLWSIPLEPSYSGPIVDGDRVYVTETKDRKFEVARAIDTESGKTLWQTQWEGSMSVPFFAASNGSWIRATPATDGERLFVAGMRDVLVCLDVVTGEQQWKVDFTQRYKSTLPAFGFVSSPLVVGDYVYVQAGASFVKLDKRTGESVWRTLDDGGGMFGSAFSSPMLETVNGQPRLLVQTRKTLAAVDPESGEVTWSRDIEAFRGMNILTPTVIGDSVFTSSYGGKSILLKIQESGSSVDQEPIWLNKTQAYMSSPVVIGDHVYLHLRNKRFTCINLKTGENTWTTEPFGQYWSMIAQGNRILALDCEGELRLIEANPSEFRLLSERKVSDNSWAHVAIRGDRVYVRELNGLTAYRWTDAADSGNRAVDK